MSQFKYFDFSEFACKETGENHINPNFVARLDMLREKCGFPFTITSGYRSPEHSKEAVKEKPGRHSKGDAADIHVADGIQRRKLVHEALKMGFGGIGVANTFVHVDGREATPVMWTY